MMTKKQHCKSLAKKTRGWLNHKDWIKIEKIQRETDIEDLIKHGTILTHRGKFELKDQVFRKIKSIGTQNEIEVGGGKRIVYTPAPSMKEKLNAERTK
jgi:nucleoid DNA-binding protein